MAEVGHPERSLRGALVGGTNGKGSVVAMARSVLSAAGLRVGHHAEAAPRHVSRADRDRRRADQRRPTSRRPSNASCRPSTGSLPRSGRRPSSRRSRPRPSPSSRGAGVDLAIVEVGMGGRLDATNVLDLGVAAITNVQRDHEAYLGPHAGRHRRREGADHQARQPGGDGRLGSRPAARSWTDAPQLAVPLRRAGPRQPYRARCATPAGTASSSTPGRPRAGCLACGSGCWGHTRPKRGRGPGAARGHGRAMGHRPGRADAARAGWRRHDGRDGWSCSTGRGIGARGASSSTAPTTRQAPRRWRGRWQDLGLRRPTIVFGAMRGKKRAGRPAGPGAARAPLRLHPRRRSRRHRPSELGAGVAAGRRARSASRRRRRRMRSPSLKADPVVVAGSLYLVGAVRGMITGNGEED